MLTAEGWMVLEFNVRMGDPESQVVFPRLESNLANVLYVLAGGDTYLEPLVWSENAAVTVVMTAGGYPDKYRKGDVITGLEAAAELPDVTVMHAGTKAEEGQITTNGGRVLNITALGPTLEEARTLAYQAVGLIDWDDVAYRHDIAE
jgi:phosphoribosylamine---glycine ligase